MNAENERFIWYELFTEINIRAMMNVYRLTNDLEAKVKQQFLFIWCPGSDRPRQKNKRKSLTSPVLAVHGSMIKNYELTLYLGNRSKWTRGVNSSFEQILSQTLQRDFWHDVGWTKHQISVCLQRTFAKKFRPIRFSTFGQRTWVETTGIICCNIKLLQFHMQQLSEKTWKQTWPIVTCKTFKLTAQ